MNSIRIERKRYDTQILYTSEIVKRQLSSCRSKWTENEGKLGCPKQRNIAPEFTISTKTSLKPHKCSHY
ncbi:hypothetical protein T11_9007 [Trichinella zimbabwensis]|uniref:Uncharacterized protein n=1 Tax=Trichinella zimbabwensis TaxID=268475 RepID=A0A0V1HX41_9BILA|nr:hypothetical protein T11_9007 [Trichinella zimbabwensis]